MADLVNVKVMIGGPENARRFCVRRSILPEHFIAQINARCQARYPQHGRKWQYYFKDEDGDAAELETSNDIQCAFNKQGSFICIYAEITDPMLVRNIWAAQRAFKR